MATPTGFEPAISSVTGRRDNHFTTESHYLDKCTVQLGSEAGLRIAQQG